MGKQHHKKNLKRKIAIIIVVVMLIIVAIPLVYVAATLNRRDFDNSQDSNIIVNEELVTQPQPGYKTIALFGVDSRSNTLSSGSRSDTIMLVSINNQTKDVKLCSIYRDTFVEIPPSDYTKINHAYAKGGYALALSTINANFDLNVMQYVTVNFYAVTRVIDLLGGIEVDIQENELKWVNGYLNEINRVNQTNVTGLSHAGLQTLNGAQALAYSRIRYTSGGDFKRTERQRLVVNKVFEKAKSADPATLLRIITEMLPNVSTNITSTEILSLSKDILKYNIADSTGFPFEKTTGYLNKVSYVFPIDLLANVTQLHAYLYDETDYVPSKTVDTHNQYMNSLGY